VGIGIFKVTVLFVNFSRGLISNIFTGAGLDMKANGFRCLFVFFRLRGYADWQCFTISAPNYQYKSTVREPSMPQLHEPVCCLLQLNLFSNLLNTNQFNPRVNKNFLHAAVRHSIDVHCFENR